MYDMNKIEFFHIRIYLIIPFLAALEYRNDFEKPKYPIYGEYGLQTGVSLFNLTKIRNLPKRWTRELRSINIKYNEYSL